MKKLLLSVAVMAVLSGCQDSSYTAPVTPTATVALIGDMPYGGSPTDTAEFIAEPNFIAAINADKDVSMVAHVGDIHSGKQYCTYDYDMSIFNHWQGFKTPLVYTPGDNEWTDCHKKKEGGGAYNSATGQIDYVKDANGNYVDYAAGDPIANLDLVRTIFFSNRGKTLGVAADVHTQATEFDPTHQTDSSFVENVWYEKANVLFAAVNIPGGSNNGTDPWYGAPSMSPAQAQEIKNRTGATLRWLDTVFANATKNNDQAMVLMIQADMWDLDGLQMSDMHLTEYKQYIDKIATLVSNYGKPVLLINGDSHIYRSDNPYVNGALCKVEVPSTKGSKSIATTTCADSVANGALKGLTLAEPYRIVQDKSNPSYMPSYNLPNFHRIVVHGNATPSGTDLEYIKLTIDTSANYPTAENRFGPFSWTRVQP
jgi:hypothetical protein